MSRLGGRVDIAPLGPSHQLALTGILRASLSEVPAVCDARVDALLSHTGGDGVRLLWVDGRPVGAAYAAAPRPRTTRGWLVALAVSPDVRRRGRATALVGAVCGWLSERGADEVAVGGPGEAYLLPGLDQARYPEAARLLRGLGFDHDDGATFGMSVALSDPPRDARSDLQARLTVRPRRRRAPVGGDDDRLRAAGGLGAPDDAGAR